MDYDGNCPFDGDFCYKKQQFLNEWREFCARNCVRNFVMTYEKILPDCPVEYDQEREQNCQRYRRYLFIMNKVKNAQR